MHPLQPDLLWIGNALDARNPKELFEHGISAVVDLAYEERPAQLPNRITYCRFPLNDGEGNSRSLLKQALQTTFHLMENRISTLIACSAGMSRSPTMAAFTLAGYLNEDPQDLLKKISKVRSLEIKSILWNDMASVFSEITNG